MNENQRYLVLDLWASDFVGEAARRAAKEYCRELEKRAPKAVKKMTEMIEQAELEAIKRKAKKEGERNNS